MEGLWPITLEFAVGFFAKVELKPRIARISRIFLGEPRNTQNTRKEEDVYFVD
jgi:hypothetical protein